MREFIYELLMSFPFRWNQSIPMRININAIKPYGDLNSSAKRLLNSDSKYSNALKPDSALKNTQANTVRKNVVPI